MGDATARDLRRALDVVHAVHEDGDAGLTALGGLVGCELVGVIRTDHVSLRLTGVAIDRPERNMVARPGFAAAVAGHPAFTAHRAGRLTPGRAVALTDLADRATLRALPLYTDFYRPEGTADQLLTVIGLSGRHGSVLVFNRSRAGFSRRDREVVDLVAPHVSLAAERRERTSALLAATRHAARQGERAAEFAARWPTLTDRERQVVAQAADGSTTREVARRLCVSPRTVHKHLEQIYRKLGTTNRAGLVALVAATTRA
jgi:DNA-binding CsgD family transcriptional regulator